MKKFFGRNLRLLVLVFMLVLMMVFVLPVYSEEIGDQPLLQKVDIIPENDKIRIQMYFDQVVEFDDFSLSNPERFVVDLKNAEYITWYQQLSVEDSLLKQIRIFHHQNGLRMVVELNYDGPWYELFWHNAENRLEMVIHRKFNSKESINLADGVKYYQIRQGLNAGPVLVQALDIEISFSVPKIKLKTSFKSGGVRGFSKVSDLARQEEGIAGINGGYFGPDGLPLGLLIQDGKLMSLPINNRTAWGIDKDGNMRMEQVDFEADVTIDGICHYLSGYNRSRYSDQLILYSSAYGQRTGTNLWGYEVVIKDGEVINTQLGNSEIPEDSFVLSGHGIFKTLLKGLKVGDKVMINLKLTPDWIEEDIVQAIGGGPKLVENGIIRITGEEEKFLPDILTGRAPRTALGITPKGHLLMVVVDGRSQFSIGMTLQELAELMISMGASQAMNLDGGKSSTLVIRDKVFNSPPNGEIFVHNGLIVKIN